MSAMAVKSAQYSPEGAAPARIFVEDPGRTRRGGQIT
jgi:hypothetical protein